ncbi:hypothetical protein [Curtanaerobium respiraculi]|uniref:hypothetical protein n=1 Tax=Curtanaerobium respiraculi TaxID=2949669 RepID=UPI0024B32170|nr:hypothetical protein [Curtanaerobium respiraculi]
MNEALYQQCADCHKDSVDDRKAALQQVQSEYTARLDEATAAVNSLNADSIETTESCSGDRGRTHRLL